MKKITFSSRSQAFLDHQKAINHSLRQMVEACSMSLNPRYIIGIDWSAGHGMIRGEVIKRRDNVVFVRFRTVTV